MADLELTPRQQRGRMYDAELEEYRNLMSVPDKFEDGFTWSTFLGVFFIALVMAPGSMYLGLVAGGSLGTAATWVTIILFAEIAKRSFTSLKRQEIYILFYVSGALLGGQTGTFQGLIWNQYFVRSPAAEGFGIAHLIPRWVAPPANSEAIAMRTFLHKDWLLPIMMLLIGMAISRISWFGLGYTLFRVTSDLQRLPFPMAPIAAQGSMALAESAYGKETWRWRCFSIGAMAGICFGALYVGIPTLSQVLTGGTPFTLLPIPWIELTDKTQQWFPAMPTGLMVDLGVVLAGFVLPFWVVMGTFIGAVASFVINPMLYKYHILHTWRPGMDTIQTSFVNGLDFWMSFGIGISFAVAMIGIYQMIKALRGAKKDYKHERGSLAPKPGRGDFPLWISVGAFLFSSCATIVMAIILVPGFPILFFLLFAFVFTPLESYMSAYMIGMAGQWVGIPMVREGFFILSGYKGVNIWFAPIPYSNYGGMAQSFREIELTGTKLTSVIKAELIMVPIVLVTSFVFWSFIWRLAPIPSASYPYAQKMWNLQAMGQALWLTGTAGGGRMEGPEDTRWRPNRLQDKTTYYWRVRADDAQGYGPWSEEESFTVDTSAPPKAYPVQVVPRGWTPPKALSHTTNQPPTAPAPLFPPNGTVVSDLQPELVIKNATDPDKDILTYQFQIVPGKSDFTVATVQSSETTSWLKKAIKIPYASIGAVIGLGLYILLSLFGLPIMLVFGFIRSIGGIPHGILPEMLGALLGKYYFINKFGRKNWREYAPILSAGFACGMGLIGMAAIAIALISKSVSPLPF